MIWKLWRRMPWNSDLLFLDPLIQPQVEGESPFPVSVVAIEIQKTMLVSYSYSDHRDLLPLQLVAQQHGRQPVFEWLPFHQD